MACHQTDNKQLSELSVHWWMCVSQFWWVNSLAPGKFEWNFKFLIFQIISVIDGWVISTELALWWMSLDLTDDKSTLVQVMAWCRQATSHYLNQCWPRSLSPYGVTRPQWVNRLETWSKKLSFHWRHFQMKTFKWNFLVESNYDNSVLVQAIIGNKPSPEPMLIKLIKMSDTIWCYKNTMS